VRGLGGVKVLQKNFIPHFILAQAGRFALFMIK
jgi:hypothetical protein